MPRYPAGLVVLAAVSVLVPGRRPVVAAAAAPPTPRFVSERVELTLRPGQLCVTGDYVFACRGAVEDFPIFYPFPVDRQFGVAKLRSSRISCDGAAEESLGVVCEAAGCHFLLPAAGHDTCRVQFVYRQPLSGSRATYILTSTRAWGRPLDRAEFEITAPFQMAKQLRVNYPFTHVGRVGETLVYRLVRHQFLPDRDLIIEFKPAR